MNQIEIDSNHFVTLNSSQHLLNADVAKSIYKPRNPFSHKGNFGHALLIAGSTGMAGAAVLAARACMRTGVGKLTCATVKNTNDILQISIPEAICKISGKNFIKNIGYIEHYDAIGIGPGLGKHVYYSSLLPEIFSSFKKPIIIDADALNVIAENKKLLKTIPAGCILTPHPAEFSRLFGKIENIDHRLKIAVQKAAAYNLYIILKGHHTAVITPHGDVYFNTSGNAGMATAGSGDVLTGMLTAIGAQGYSSLETCLLGVYLHGIAGDIAAKKYSQEALIASDIIENIGEAFKLISSERHL